MHILAIDMELSVCDAMSSRGTETSSVVED